MSYVGDASTVIVPVVSYENTSNVQYSTTSTPTSYLSITFTPKYSGYALVQYNLQATSSVATSTSKLQAQIYQDGFGVGFIPTITNPGLNHQYEINGLKRIAVIAGSETIIDVKVNYLTTDNQIINSGTLTILTNFY